MSEKNPSSNGPDEIQEHRDLRDSNNVGDALNGALEKKGIDQEGYKKSLSEKDESSEKQETGVEVNELIEQYNEGEKTWEEVREEGISLGILEEGSEDSGDKNRHKIKTLATNELGEKMLLAKKDPNNPGKKGGNVKKSSEGRKKNKETETSKEDNEAIEMEKKVKEILELFNSKDEEEKIYEHKAMTYADEAGLLKNEERVAVPVEEHKELAENFLKAINMTVGRQRELIKEEREEEAQKKNKLGEKKTKSKEGQASAQVEEPQEESQKNPEEIEKEAQKIYDKKYSQEIKKTGKWIKKEDEIRQQPLIEKLDKIDAALEDIKPGAINIDYLQKMVGTNKFAIRVNRFKKEGDFTVNEKGKITSINSENGKEDIDKFLVEAKRTLIGNFLSNMFEDDKDYSSEDQLRKAYNKLNAHVGGAIPDEKIEIGEVKASARECIAKLLEKRKVSISNIGEIIPVDDESKKALEVIKEKVREKVEDRYYKEKRGSDKGSVELEAAVNKKIRDSEVGKAMIGFMNQKEDEITALKPRTFIEKMNLVFNRGKNKSYRRAEKDLASMKREYGYWHKNEQKYLDGIMEFQMKARQAFGQAEEGDIDPKKLSNLRKELHELMLQRRFIAKNNIKRINELGNFGIPEKTTTFEVAGIDYAKLLSEEEEKVKSELIEEINFDNTSLINKWFDLENIPEDRRDEFLRKQTGDTIKRWAEERLRSELLKNSLNVFLFDPKVFDSERMLDFFDQLQQGQLDSKKAEIMTQRQVNITIRGMFYEELKRDIKEDIAVKLGSEVDVDLEPKLRDILETGHNRLSRFYQLGERALERIQWGFYSGGAQSVAGLDFVSEYGLQRPLETVGLRIRRLEGSGLDEAYASLQGRADDSTMVLGRLKNIRESEKRSGYISEQEEKKEEKRKRRRSL